ncbi:hypothetical protein [Streptomyces sp. NBC_00094]|uniref:hypothetical protein n=1 Tax=Streptomyces sp. NBC_00094 TaxID=2903620 RepID=UPI0022585033|nr:hypothetical protein [Streptomyces sp. NBC_00094]MCX5394452.1 hypothetical protein [Streptomyces sp. NBC_00094]
MPDDRRNGGLEESLRAALGDVTRGGATLGALREGHDHARAERTGREAEESALAAFRAARDAGLHTSRPTRDRDDWTPSGARRLPRRSLRTTVAVLVASVTLGGVAVATADLPGHLLGTPSPAPAPEPGTSAPDRTPDQGPGPTSAPVLVAPDLPGPPLAGTPFGPDGPDRFGPTPPAATREARCLARGTEGREKAVETAGPAFCRADPPPGHDAGPGAGARSGGRNDPAEASANASARARAGRP